MVFDLFLGCVIPARLPYLEVSSRKIFEKLGIELRDVDGFSSVSYTHLTLPTSDLV